MEPYFHRQNGKAPLAMLSIPFVILLVLLSRGLRQGESFSDIWQLAAGALLVLSGMILMSYMKIQVDSDQVLIKLGPLPVRKRIPLSDISGIKRTSIPWYSSGIKKIRRGWLFSVDSSPAIELSLLSGRRYIIGTDDPEGISDAIRSRNEKILMQEQNNW